MKKIVWNPKSIPSEKRVSMERAFLGEAGTHRSIHAVALHVGVKCAQAKALLRHLIETKQIPRTNPLAKRVIAGTKKKQ